MRSAIEWVRILTWGAIPKREQNIKEIQADALRWAYGEISRSHLDSPSPLARSPQSRQAQDRIEAKIDELDPP